jgi:hypothetical protein
MLLLERVGKMKFYVNDPYKHSPVQIKDVIHFDGVLRRIAEERREWNGGRGPQMPVEIISVTCEGVKKVIARHW